MKAFHVVMLVFVVLSGFILFAAVFMKTKEGNAFFARLFRDLSRYKSRKRIFGKEMSLIPFLMKKDKEIKLREYVEDDLQGTTITLAELAEFDGRIEDTPIYVGIKGLVYDVSLNREAYKPGSGYSCFVAKDSTILYATGCCGGECPGSFETLTEYELSELDSWLEFYHNHDKYKYVGRIIADPVEYMLAKDFGEPTPKMITSSVKDIKKTNTTTSGNSNTNANSGVDVGEPIEDDAGVVSPTTTSDDTDKINASDNSDNKPTNLVEEL